MRCEYCALELGPDVEYACQRCGWKLALLVICAWCRLVMISGHTPASHGVCGACAERAFNER